MKVHNFEVVFDNGGGITVQCDEFVHAYEDASQAARDARELLQGADPSDWEGNEPAHRIAWTDEQVRNGGYQVLFASDVPDALLCEDTGWHNIDEFVRALRTLASFRSA